MLRETCKKILMDLELHKNNSKEELFFQAINERLNDSFESYQHDLNLSLEYLKRRDELNVSRRMSRLK